MCDSAVQGAPWEERLHDSSVSALYLHLPFCARKCDYCDFASWTTSREDPLMVAYRSALEGQLREVADLGMLRDCETAYVGGGTPTLLGTGLGELVRRVRGVAPVTELTCEANPDSLADEVIEAVRAAGGTRLSIGVQSLDDDELSRLGRIHSAVDARDRVRAAVASGLAVSCDLMCATPGQTGSSWERTLRETVLLGVGHISVYPLMIEEGTALSVRVGGGSPAWNDEDVESGAHAPGAGRPRGCRPLSAMRSQAMRDRRGLQAHITYWTGGTYLGLGTSALSMLSVEGYLILSKAVLKLPCPHLTGLA